jgi:hypothetical protein
MEIRASCPHKILGLGKMAILDSGLLLKAPIRSAEWPIGRVWGVKLNHPWIIMFPMSCTKNAGKNRTQPYL